MPTSEKRKFPRYRTEVVVAFNYDELKVTGLTSDVSHGGMFVRTTRLPKEGEKLLITLRFPDRQLLLQGQVLRTVQAPNLAGAGAPGGFAISIGKSESYRRFVESVARAQGGVSQPAG